MRLKIFAYFEKTEKLLVHSHNRLKLKDIYIYKTKERIFQNFQSTFIVSRRQCKHKMKCQNWNIQNTWFKQTPIFPKFQFGKND